MTHYDNLANIKDKSNAEAASWYLAKSLWITHDSYSPEMQYQTELKASYFSSPYFKKGVE